MISPRRLVPLVCLLWSGVLFSQQTVPPLPAGEAPLATAPDERAARVAERYKSMLLANPVEGLALERLWKFYDERDATGELIEEFHRRAESPDASASACLIYGHLLKRAGRLDEAGASYEKAQKLDPASPLPSIALAELALARAHPEEAARLFTAGLEKLPAGDRREPEVLLKLGTAWMAAGQPLKAAESWEKIVSCDPANVGLRRQLAENYEKNSLSERALVHYQYIVDHAEPAERVAALRDMARLHESRGEFDAAREALERGLSLTARDNWLSGELQTRLIRLYQRAGRVPELETRWRAAVETAPRDLGGYLRLEALAEAQGDVAAERGWLEKIVALAPHERDSMLKLARRLADDGDRARAASLYDELLKAQPGNLDLIFARADLDLQLGQPAAAAARIEARVAQNPADESVTTPALAFFLEHHLDEAAEKSLRAEVARRPSATEPALALAKFLFTVRKLPEAHATLAALTSQPGEDAACSARWLQVAEIYRGQNLTDEALHAWQEAASSQPRSAAPLLASGEYLLSRGDKSAAVEQFDKAAQLATGQEQIDAERKLFEVLQTSDEAGPGRRDSGAFTAGVSSVLGGARASESLARHLKELEQMAQNSPTSDHLLRLARWQRWAHLPEAALASATKAVEADPANIAARELLATAASELHQTVVADGQLQEMAARDPARKNGYLRQSANLKMDAGDYDSALEIFLRLQHLSPGSREAFADLALAQQRADRWYDALATWERAYALPGATAAQRGEIRRALLAAYEHLTQFPAAAEVLRGAVDEQTDLAAKIDLFHEMADFCHRHDLGNDLRTDYEKRLAARPDDYFLLNSVAELRREDGQEREAYVLLLQAFYSSPDPARSLRELADEAEQLGEEAEAVKHQRRLVALPDQSTAANLEKLAALEEVDLDEPAAAQTWNNIVAKFPRDTAALGHAAEFFQKADQLKRAGELLRQLMAVDGTDVRRLMLLANVDTQAGDTAGARECFEQVLTLTTPEKTDEPLLVPPDLEPPAEGTMVFGVGSTVPRYRRYLSRRPETSPAGENEERRLRLQAIENLSRLLFPKDEVAAKALAKEQQTWLARWKTAAVSGAKSEPLTAFYFSGQQDLTMDLLSNRMHADGAEGELARNVFLTAGLRLGAYRTLAAWAWQGTDGVQTANRGQKLLAALQNYLGAGGKPGANMVAELFPPEVHVRETLWAAAQNGFATAHWYTQAAELGERVLASAHSSRASFGVEVAEWELYAGNPARAREALRVSIEDSDGDSFEMANPAFVALRGYYLLLPEKERAAFVEAQLKRVQPMGGSAHAVLTAALLHGLAGDESAAHRDLDRLLSLRMLSSEPANFSPDIRRWVYLLANGQQLEAWNLDSLAIHLWQRALKEAGGFDPEISDTENTVTELRQRLLNAQIATAPDPQQARERVQEFLESQPAPALMSALATQFWNEGQRVAAARLYEILCQADSANTDYWPNLYNFYQSMGNQDATERLLIFMLADGRKLPLGLGRPELISDLAALREKQNDLPGACRWLERARMLMPGHLPVLFQLAQTYERANRWDDAANVWREALPLDPNHTACVDLASVEEHRGNVAAAIATLRGGLKDGPDPTRVEVVTHLIRLLLAEHRTDEARQLALDLVKKGQLESLAAIGKTLVAAGERTVAQEVLAAAVLRAHEPATRFHLQQAVVEQWSAPGEDEDGFVRQMRRLEKFAQSSEMLRNEYDTLLYPLAHRQRADAWVESELQRAWKHGEGDPAAGVKLAGIYLQSHRDDVLREVVQTIDHRPDLPESLLFALETSLVDTGHAPLALALCERLARRFPQKQEYQMERALALWKSDRPADANQLLDALAAACVLREDVLVQIADFYRQQGDKDRAAEYLGRFVKNDPAAARAPQAWLQLAQIQLDQKKVAEAGRLLRVAYARPACEDLGPLLRYLESSGGFDGDKASQMPAPEFPLTFARRAQLLAAVHDWLNQHGRADEGRRLIETHAEFLAATPALAAEFRRTATSVNVANVADCIERAAAQSATPPPSLSRQMASLYMQWAEWDANDSSAQDRVLKHLERAFELTPDDFAVAGRLAKAYLESEQIARAGEVLAAFLTPEAFPAEREQAQRILDEH